MLSPTTFQNSWHFISPRRTARCQHGIAGRRQSCLASSRVWQELIGQGNPFALVTVAHLLAQRTRRHIHQRRIAKWRLTKLLYQRNWDRQRIINLYRVIDWILRLPIELDRRVRTGILQLERRATMPYLSSMERIGMEIGRKEGLEKGLQEGLQKGHQEGRQKGRQEGRQEGVRLGSAEVLSMVLKARFGPLDPAVRSRIDAADTQQITQWAENSVHADTLEAVFRSK